jgi:tetratricopeptide (TPR) repeat protein
MEKSRQEVLQEFLAANPNDSFVRYGLAQEYVKSGQPEKAVEQFRELIRLNPNYAAAYYHAGQTLEKLGHREDARAIYSEGIQITMRTGDQHAQSELQAALDLL